jgi:Kdo2-lipid IVA lauroyltransferase/acyltransferase
VFVDRILIFVIKSVQQILRVLPEKAQIFTGKSFGRLTFVLLRSRKEVAVSNIKRVFTDLTDKDIKAIAKSNFEKLGTNVIEFFLVPFLSDKQIADRFSVAGKEFFEEALHKGKGIIALGFHFGNWEVTGIISKLLGHNIIALARPLKKRVLLNGFLNHLRQSTGLTIIVNENSGKEVMKLLRENNIVAILGDQREKRSRGVFVELFGTKVPTSKGVAAIAMKTGTTVIPVYSVRKGFLRYQFVCGSPLEMERKGDIEELIEKNTRKINAFLETIIIQYPDEWFWVHRRWGRRNKNNDLSRVR